MASAEKENWQLLLKWERSEVPNPPGITDIALHQLTRRYWDTLRNKREYLAILRAVVTSMALTRSHHTKFLRRQRELRNSQNQDSFARYCSKQDRLYANVNKTLQDVLDHKRQMQGELLVLECAQGECLDRVGSREHTRNLVKKQAREIEETKWLMEAFEEEKGRYLHWDHDASDKKRKAHEMEDVETRRQKAARVAAGGGKAEVSGGAGKGGRTRGGLRKVAATGEQAAGDGGDDGSDEEKRDRKARPKDRADLPPRQRKKADEDGDEDESDPEDELAEDIQDAPAPNQEGIEQNTGDAEAPERDTVTAQGGGTAAGAGDPDNGNSDSSDDDEGKGDPNLTPLASDDEGNDDENGTQDPKPTPPASDDERSEMPKITEDDVVRREGGGEEEDELDLNDNDSGLDDFNAEPGVERGGDTNAPGQSASPARARDEEHAQLNADSPTGDTEDIVERDLDDPSDNQPPGREDAEEPDTGSERAAREGAIDQYYKDLKEYGDVSEACLQYAAKQLDRLRSDEEKDPRLFFEIMNAVVSERDVVWEDAPDVEVFYAEIQQRGEFMARLGEHENCQRVVRYAQNHLFGQNDVARRVTVIGQLIGRHGLGPVWDRMPALVEYVSGTIDVAASLDDPSSFDSEKSGIEGSWNALGEIGSGGFGKATLWVKVDALGRPVDKTVIKSVDLGRKGGGQWNSSEYWRADINNRLPREYALPKSVNLLPESFNVVETRSYVVYEERQIYNIYLEYCPRGSLGDWLKRYQKVSTLLDSNGAPVQGRIPVRVLWSIFEALASAVCLMHKGYLPGSQAPLKENFTPFVHRDIKPDNVFLADPDETFWPQIPVAKMGDFGCCVLKEDVEGAVTRGTEGWRAPEMEEYAPFEGYEDDFPEEYDPEDYAMRYPPTASSDIWSLGRVMLCLVNLEDPLKIPPWRFDQNEGLPRPYTDPLDTSSGLHSGSYYADVEAYYPTEMRELVEDCLQMEPSERIKPADLWSAVHSHVAAGKGLRGRTLREMPRGGLGEELLLVDHVDSKNWIKDS